MGENGLEFYVEEKRSAPGRSEPSGWEKWHDWQAAIMRPVTDWFIRAVDAAPGMTILDVACGSGLPTLALAERVGASGKVVAVDVVPTMLTATRRKAATAKLTNVETRETSADAIGGPDAAFDAVTCKDGLMFCGDIVAALRELRRVLKPGGRFAFAVWAEPEANPAFTTLFGPLVEAMQLPPPPPDAPGPFRLAGPGELERVIRAAGFTDIAIERVAITWTFTSVAQHWDAFSELAGPLERAVATLSPPELAQLKQKIADAIGPFAMPDGVRIPGVELCATGIR
jgi:SAM-dependent methyltransferase